MYPGGYLSASQETGTIFFQQQVRAALAGLVEAENQDA